MHRVQDYSHIHVVMAVVQAVRLNSSVLKMYSYISSDISKQEETQRAWNDEMGEES